MLDNRYASFTAPPFILSAPLVLYLIERTIRVIRGSQKTIVVKAIQHPAKTIEIRLKKASFKYKSGQYVFLQCPYIAGFEW